MARLTLVKVRLVWWELSWGLELRVMWVGVKLKNCAILKKLCNPSDSNLLAVGLPLLECWRCEEGKFYLNSRSSQTMFLQCTDLIKTDQDRICFLFLPGKKGTCFYSSFLYFSQKTLLCSCIVKGVKEKKLIGLLSSSISTLTSLLKLSSRLVGTNQVDWK